MAGSGGRKPPVRPVRGGTGRKKPPAANLRTPPTTAKKRKAPARAKIPGGTGAVRSAGPKQPRTRRQPKTARIVDLNAARSARAGQTRTARTIARMVSGQEKWPAPPDLPFAVPPLTEITRYMGRPAKLNNATMTRIVELIAAGNVAETAAMTCGVGRSTFYEWTRKGRLSPEAAEQEGLEWKRLAPYRDFLDVVQIAEAFSESWYLDVVRRGVVDDPRLAMAVLERRWPRRYGRVDRIKAEISSREAGDIVGSRELPSASIAASFAILRDVGALELLAQNDDDGEILEGEVVEDGVADSPQGGE